MTLKFITATSPLFSCLKVMINV